jgi:hypothetical protein
MIDVNIFLFGKPEWMMDLEKAKAKDFGVLGKDLCSWLKRVGEIVEKLEKAGWDRSAGLYDLFYSKALSKKDAKKELRKLGISLREVSLRE